MEPRYRLPEQDELEPYQPPEPYRDYEPIQPEPGWKSTLRKAWAPLAAAGAALVKYGAVLFKAKFFFSIFVSFGVYLWIGGVWFAVGLIVLLFVHEMGHVIEAKRQGLDVTAPMFIPLLGAMITLKENPRDAWHEARLALAGPIVGSLGAAAIYLAGVADDSNRLKAIAFLGFFLNLFNLLPVVPLDGGRAMAAMAPWMWFLGLAAMLTLVFIAPNPILILIVLLGAFETYRRWQERGTAVEGNAEYYKVAPRHRVAVGVVYVGLVVALALGMDATHVVRTL